MTQKQRLQELLQKMKEWAESRGDETLEEHIATLGNEIQLMSEADDVEEGGGGGNNPPLKPNVP